MSMVVIGLGDPKAVKRFSGTLLTDVGRKEIFTRKWTGKGEASKKPIMQLVDLEKEKGDQISFDLTMAFSMQPIEGDNTIHGKEEGLNFYTQVIYIDQMRGGANCGGAMSRKRTLYDLRALAKTKSVDWWAQVQTQIKFMYLSGARGSNTDWLFPTTYTSFANNSLTSPDTNHIVYGGVATAFSSTGGIATTDTMSTLPIDRAVAYAAMMGGSGPAYSKVPQIQPNDVEGEEMFLLIMNPYQAFNLRRNTTTNDWADVTKAMAMATGRDNEFIKGGLGIWNGVVLHQHANVVQFTTAGVSSNVNAARALFLGRQAGVVAFGSPGGDLRFGWHEETDDRGNQIIINTNAMWGFEKATFNGNDYGVIAIDTAATRP